MQYALVDCTAYQFTHQQYIFSEAVRNGQMDCILFLQRKGFTLLCENSPSLFHHHVNRLKSADLARTAASSGHVEVLKYLHSQGCSIYHAATAAADAGHWDCLEYALEHNALLRGEWEHTQKGSLAQRLARANLLKLFPLALSRGDKIDAQTALSIAIVGNAECLKLCIDHGIRPSIKLVAVVAENGHLACLQLLHEVCTLAAEGTGQAFNWLSYAAKIGKSNLRPTDIAQMVAKAQQWECLRFLITHDCPMDSSLLVCLVQAEQLELYRLAVTHSGEVPVVLACALALEGNLPLLKHALEHGCERSEEILRVAAHHGQLPCLKYARAQGCPWSALVTMEAAHGGHLECLQYLHEHGCPWDARVRSGKRKQCIADYADAHDCPF